MERKKLLASLRRLKVQTGSLVCRGCGLANKCMDRVLLEIMRGKRELIPFQERYPHLREIKYGC